MRVAVEYCWLILSAAWRACGTLSATELRLTLDSTIYACIDDHMQAQYLMRKIHLVLILRIRQKWESVSARITFEVQ
jgi:hypothetical protein